MTIWPKSGIVDLANTQYTTTLTLVVNHLDVSYTVGQPTLTVPTTSVTVTAPTASPNINMRVMDTTTKLYYSTNGGTTYTEVTTAASATWTSVGAV